MATTTEPQDNLFTLTLPKLTKEEQVLKVIEDSTTTRGEPTTTRVNDITALGLSAIEALLPESTTTAAPTSTRQSPLSDATVKVSKDVPTTTAAPTSTAAPTTTQLTTDVATLQKKVADLEEIVLKMATTTAPSQVDLRSIFPSGGGKRTSKKSRRPKRRVARSKKRSRK